MRARVMKTLLAAILCLPGSAHAQGPQQSPPPNATRAMQLPLSGRSGQSGGVVINQAVVPGVTTSVNTLSTNVQVQGPYTGSIRSGASDLPDGKLTLKEAIRRG